MKYCEYAPCGQWYKWPPVANIIRLFLGVIYATGGIFPYDLDRGYANSDVITLKKVLKHWPQGVYSQYFIFFVT
jgi:hypothetical protein